MKPKTTADVLRAIADDRSRELFVTIALSEGIGSDTLKQKSKLTRKQYYSRLARMTQAGLVRKRKGRYILTMFGRIVYDAQAAVDRALGNFWKLKAIDSLETSNELPKEEQQDIINALLGKTNEEKENRSD